MTNRHIISTKQFLDIKTLDSTFQVVEQFAKQDLRGKIPKKLKNKILASVFYEPSTRTRFSFEAAMLKLGGEVISTESAGHFSYAIKGESLEDTIRVIGGYADVIVLRHPDVGAAESAAKVSSVPIINAGDGQGEHPTQALLDLYTIKSELKRIDNFTIALVGNLLYGRTIHSLIHLLSMCKKVKVFLVSPKGLSLPQKYKLFMQDRKIKFEERSSLDRILSVVDVLYITRIQKERFPSLAMYRRVKDAFIIDKKILKKLKKKAVIMHPLPRLAEISTEVDSDPRAAYFRQARNGLYIRMALLDKLLGG
jgi:aspartate carbamoyltransferase catalytic subunit